MTLKEMRNREIIGASQDKEKEWVSLLATIYIVVMKILPLLINQREYGDLQNSWVEDADDNTIYLAAIPT